MLRNKIETLKACTRCPLSKVRHNVVTGRGSLPCDVLLLGERPERNDDYTGRAFGGESGKLLDKMLSKANKYSIKLYMVNIVLCRPADSRKDDTRSPNSGEVLLCAENVNTIIARANPKAVILLGDVPFQYYKKEFPDALRIPSPQSIAETGGITSPLFLGTVRTLETFFSEYYNGV